MADHPANYTSAPRLACVHAVRRCTSGCVGRHHVVLLRNATIGGPHQILMAVYLRSTVRRPRLGMPGQPMNAGDLTTAVPLNSPPSQPPPCRHAPSTNSHLHNHEQLETEQSRSMTNARCRDVARFGSPAFVAESRLSASSSDAQRRMNGTSAAVSNIRDTGSLGWQQTRGQTEIATASHAAHLSGVASRTIPAMTEGQPATQIGRDRRLTEILLRGE
jgi:hypothetical protein